VKVLAVDDEPQILRAIRTSLVARGHEVVTAPNGETALDLLAGGDLDVVVLDLGLPGIDGVEVIRRVRPWSDVPIIVLSVRDAPADKIAALDAGADDYVAKPFSIDELQARMRAVLRRRGPSQSESPVVAAGSLEVDLSKSLVSRAGRRIHLTPTEFSLLEQFVTHPGKLLTHRWLLQEVWGVRHFDHSNYLRVYVAGLRKKLDDDPTSPSLILTEPGVGYRWIGDSNP
jgi:two-component system KDP operon response regulator KdpE